MYDGWSDYSMVLFPVIDSADQIWWLEEQTKLDDNKKERRLIETGAPLRVNLVLWFAISRLSFLTSAHNLAG